MSSTVDIAAKHQQLKKTGLDLGASAGAERDAGSGGREQRFQQGSIFWHANTGAHEVHGGILDLYRKLGGPGRHPGTGRRELGYPVTDEERTRDGLHPSCRFEFGDILFVAGTGGVAITGAFRDAWRDQGGELGSLLTPLTMPIEVAGGEAVYCERGCLFRSAATGGKVIVGRLDPPRLGQPALLKPTGGEIRVPPFISWTLPVDVHNRIKDAEQQTLFTRVWDERLLLKRVVAHDDGSETIPVFTAGVEIDEGPSVVHVRQGMRFPENGPIPLRDRTLYDLAVRLHTGNVKSIAPHAYYIRPDWSDFGFMHITDLHVAKRADHFARRLDRLAQTDPRMREARDSFVNFNDNFRDLIRYANKLHRLGALDMIIATGDFTDYAFEREDLKEGFKGGNFAFFEALVRGEVASPGNAAREELTVPIFVQFGNHDYRLAPYELSFDLDHLGPNTTVSQFAGYNLLEHEAEILQGGKKTVSTNDGFEMIRVDLNDMRGDYVYCLRRICPNKTYVVKAGPHRFVMIDTGPDAGLPASADFNTLLPLVIESFAGSLSEDKEALLAGGPNLRGLRQSDVDNLRSALSETLGSGLVIVGMHGPPLNIAGGEFPHYFRETEHPTADKRQFVAYTIRRHTAGQLQSVLGGPDTLTLNAKIQDVVHGRTDDNLRDSDWNVLEIHSKGVFNHDRWLVDGAHFMSGSTDNLLDAGVAREVGEFLEVCAGKDDGRRVDLVLCGHDHDRVEYRVQWHSGRQELRYFMDFYLDTPNTYYSSIVAGVDGQVHLQILDGAPLDGPVLDTTDNRFDPPLKFRERLIPPYSDPLGESVNPAAWWRKHAPVVAETAALGPIDRRQRSSGSNRREPTFTGFRFFDVANNVIRKGHYVSLAELRKNEFKMPFEPSMTFGQPLPLPAHE